MRKLFLKKKELQPVARKVRQMDSSHFGFIQIKHHSMKMIYATAFDKWYLSKECHHVKLTVYARPFLCFCIMNKKKTTCKVIQFYKKQLHPVKHKTKANRCVMCVIFLFSPKFIHSSSHKKELFIIHHNTFCFIYFIYNLFILILTHCTPCLMFCCDPL